MAADPTRARPRPPQAPAARSDALAACVRAHLEQHTLSQPSADLDVAALARETRALSHQLHAVLTTALGTAAGDDTYNAVLSRGGVIAMIPAWSAVRRAGARDLAARLVALRTLSERAQQALDEALLRRAPVELVTRRSRLIKSVLDAEERGDDRAVRGHLRELADGTRDEVDLARAQLARARRDHLRLTHLTTATAPPRGQRAPLVRCLQRARLLPGGR